ncbi:hypothetical protein AMAG_00425 [Allomyces macrogynus ATCC 38327]|uniref:Uncharacterized protein n=1 Tax=Allomyces macrogynus (strain ATCC 38327) TaxID=578462 RepID=A0A0L0RWI9_ALLM3|nr:hypothetical protein AMAG_00425 [Allomyces macrogynus ATCC 38327]|eukprot:KNE54451.1 hypothetical protein AMAG_00425 [Allomyces macrogynus ATCC 38327]
MSLGILRPAISVAILACDPQPAADPSPPARPPSNHPPRPTSTRTSAQKIILKRTPSSLSSSTPRVAQPSSPPCPGAVVGAPSTPAPTVSGAPSTTPPASAPTSEKHGATTRSASTRPKSVTMSLKIDPFSGPQTINRASLSPRDIPASPDRRGSRLGPIPADAAAAADHYGLVTRPGDPGHFRMVQLVRSARIRDQLSAGEAPAAGGTPSTTDTDGPEPAMSGTLARRRSHAHPWSSIAVPVPTTTTPAAARPGGAAKADAVPAAADPASGHLTLANTRILIAPVMPQTRAAARRIMHGIGEDGGPHSVLKTNMAESELLGKQKVGERKAQALLENVIGLWAKSKARRKAPGVAPSTPNTDQAGAGAPGAAAATPHTETKRPLRGAPLPHVGAGRLGTRGGKGTAAAASASALNSMQARSRTGLLHDSPTSGRKIHRVSIAAFPTHPERDPSSATQRLDHGRPAIWRTSRSTTPSTPALAQRPASDQALKNATLMSARPGRGPPLPFSARKETKPASPPVAGSTKPGRLWRNDKAEGVQNSSVETMETSSSGSSSSLESSRAGPSTPSPRAKRTAGGSRTSPSSSSPTKRGQPDSPASRTVSSPSRLTPIVTLSSRIVESPTISSTVSARPGSGTQDPPSPSRGTAPSTPRPASGTSKPVAAATATTTPIGSRPPSSSTTRPRRRRSALSGRTAEPTTAGEYLLLPSRAIHQIGRVSYYSHRRRRRVKYLLTDLATPRARARRCAVIDLARRVPTIPLATLERALLPPDDVLKPTATRKIVSTIYDRIMSAKRKGKDANAFMDHFVNPFASLAARRASRSATHANVGGSGRRNAANPAYAGVAPRVSASWTFRERVTHRKSVRAFSRIRAVSTGRVELLRSVPRAAETEKVVEEKEEIEEADAPGVSVSAGASGPSAAATPASTATSLTSLNTSWTSSTSAWRAPYGSRVGTADSLATVSILVRPGSSLPPAPASSRRASHIPTLTAIPATIREADPVGDAVVAWLRTKPARQPGMVRRPQYADSTELGASATVATKYPIKKERVQRGVLKLNPTRDSKDYLVPVSHKAPPSAAAQRPLVWFPETIFSGVPTEAIDLNLRASPKPR